LGAAQCRVARWFIFKPKVPIWVNFGVYILYPFGQFLGHLVYFMALWFISWHFGLFYGFLAYFPSFGILYHEKTGNPGSMAATS
jgi:hypothetical protein